MFYVLDKVHIMGIIIYEMVNFSFPHLSQVLRNVFSKEMVNFTSFVLYSFLCLLKYLLQCLWQKSCPINCHLMEIIKYIFTSEMITQKFAFGGPTYRKFMW